MDLPPQLPYLNKPTFHLLYRHTWQPEFMRQLHPCFSHHVFFGKYIIWIFSNNIMRSTILLPHGLSYIPQSICVTRGCYLFCTFKICFPKEQSRSELYCLVILSWTLRWHGLFLPRLILCKSTYTKPIKHIIKKLWYLLYKRLTLILRCLNTKL